ncbi:hypothetical protein P8452_17422 [Trifolium repens]|nr:hypothetical protein P8452_17422 [Trifolium repens]
MALVAKQVRLLHFSFSKRCLVEIMVKGKTVQQASVILTQWPCISFSFTFRPATFQPYAQEPGSTPLAFQSATLKTATFQPSRY